MTSQDPTPAVPSPDADRPFTENSAGSAADAAATDASPDAFAARTDEPTEVRSDISAEQPTAAPVADNGPVTGPLHTVPGGPDWRSRPSGALSAAPTSAWSAPQAGPTADPRAPYWYGQQAQPTGAFQGPQTGQWHHTMNDLRPIEQAPAAVAVAEKPKRSRRTLVGAAVVVLALGAGFGGGALATQVASSNTPVNDSSLTQQTTAAPVSAQAPAATGSVEQVASAVLPSVVSVLATSDSSGGEGSGVILTKDGLILTNNHVVEGATALTVRFNDGTTAKATVVGADATDDLAVIKATGVSGLTPATLGTSADVKVGQPVVAIGSPLGLSATVTSGIVSALNRPVRTASEQQQQQTDPQQQQDPFGQLDPNGQGQAQDQQSTTTASDTVLNAIQTDAAINPGNSGGPLVDMQGRIIGINSAIASLSTDSTSQPGSIGVGFSIPIDQAHRVAQEIINTGKAAHAVLGASVRDNAASNAEMPNGALIAQVTAGSGAEKAGLKDGDVVTKVGTLQVESADALIAAIRSQVPGGTVPITYLRGSDTATVNVTLGQTE